VQPQPSCAYEGTLHVEGGAPIRGCDVAPDPEDMGMPSGGEAVRDAFRFLTVLPLGACEGPPRTTSVCWFPLVGLVIGAAWALGFTLANRFFGPFVAAVVVLVVDALVTGAFHLDAVADVADGVASRRPPNEAVEIMREPSVGAVGAAVLVLVCLLRLSLLHLVGAQAAALVAAPIAGRAAMVLVLALIPPRQDGSLAAAFDRPSVRPTAAATILAAVSVTVLAILARDPALFLGLVLAMVGTSGYASWWRARFGPLTGDGVGMGGIFAETLALFIFGARHTGV